MESATERQNHVSAGNHSATTSDESKFSVSSEKLVSSRSSSSLSSADSRDPLDDELDRPSVSDMPSIFSHNHEAIRNLQPPTVQSMEHSTGNASSYRIPSSVFATTSGAPAEWSVASNESLFSIQMNMSFARDFMPFYGKSGELGTFKSGELGMYRKSGHLSMYNKSGELGMYKKSGELEDMRPATTGQMMNLSNCPQSAYQVCPNSHPGVSVTEAVAAETMKEVIRENEQSRGDIKVSSQKNGARSPTSSVDGGASAKSFAFPVSGDSVRSGSEDISLRPLKSNQQPPDSQTISKDKLSNAAQATSWFSCFSCWPTRS
ncbi:hypothetical protein QQ045_029966 [Rhodiola kirilowii]